MNHAGDRRARAGADVGRGAGDGAGGGNAAEERRGDVGDSLRDQFDVGVVTVAGHAVGDDRGEHAFKRGQQRHGEGRGNQRQNVLGVKVGNGEGRESARNAAESACRWFRRADGTAQHATVQASSATMEAGTRLVKRGRISMMASVASAERERLPVEAGHVRRAGASCGAGIRWERRRCGGRRSP